MEAPSQIELPDDGHELYDGLCHLVLMLRTGEALLVPPSQMQYFEAAVTGGFARSWNIVGIDRRSTAQWYLDRVLPGIRAAMNGIRTDERGDVVMTGNAESHLRLVTGFLLQSLLAHHNFKRGGSREWVTHQEWFDQCVSLGMTPDVAAMDTDIGRLIRPGEPGFARAVGRRYEKMAHRSGVTLALVPGEPDMAECVSEWLIVPAESLGHR